MCEVCRDVTGFWILLVYFKYVRHRIFQVCCLITDVPYNVVIQYNKLKTRRALRKYWFELKKIYLCCIVHLSRKAVGYITSRYDQ